MRPAFPLLLLLFAPLPFPGLAQRSSDLAAFRDNDLALARREAGGG